MILNDTYTLSNGMKIPKLGLGTWEIPDDKAAQAVRDAVKIGYRHIDTAQGYDNERGVGEGVRTCGVSREELFVTTKLQAFYKTYKEAKEAIAESLRVSGLDYFDLMIIHAPQPWTDFHAGEHFFEGNLEAWRALEEAHYEGKLKAIGVSNFVEIDLDNILKNGEVKPAVNQILCHIGNTPFDLIDYCKKNDILVEAYSPVAHGEMQKNSQISEMAKKYGVSVPQLCIRYCLQLGTLPLPKTANPAHMADNAQMSFEISNEDMETLKNAEKIKNYGDFSMFPVFGGKMAADGSCSPQDFPHKK